MATQADKIRQQYRTDQNIKGMATLTDSDKEQKWYTLARDAYFNNNPNATQASFEKFAARAKGSFIDSGTSSKSLSSNTALAKLGIDNIPISALEGAFSEFLQESFFPTVRKAGITDLPGDLNKDFDTFTQNYVEPDTTGTGTTVKDITTELPPPATDYSGLTTQLDAITGGADRLGTYRDELLRRPELEKMSPEFREYLSTTLEGIEQETREAVRRTEEGAARAGLSPYAQRRVSEEAKAGGLIKRTTEAGLKLRDLETRQETFRQREGERRSFLTSEYQNTRDVLIQIAFMMKQRENETADDYRDRIRFLEDDLRNRGYAKEDIAEAREYATTGEFRRRRWGLSDIDAFNTRQDEIYERQKADYQKLLKQSKANEKPWWQQALGAVATGAGYVFGGVAGGYAANQVSNLFSPGQQAPSFTNFQSGTYPQFNPNAAPSRTYNPYQSQPSLNLYNPYQR